METTTAITAEQLKGMKLYEIASAIRKDWKKQSKTGKVYFGAEPYLDAMESLSSVNDSYGLDSGKSIVLYFLANATTWKGEVAREIKKYLNSIVK